MSEAHDDGRVLLEIKGLTTAFSLAEGDFNAVDNVSFSVKEGRTLSLVGESGSGKSMTALSVMGLVPSPGKVVAGEVLLDGRNLLDMSAREMRKIRGAEISMIFKQPTSALNTT